MSETYVAPRLAGGGDVAVIDAEWAAAAAVAAILGLSVAVVAYICTVCEARSFSACYHAVIAYFGDGC